MECPWCLENNQKSVVFPANNLELSEEISGFLDEHGVMIQPKQTALRYGCTNGHDFSMDECKAYVFKLENPTKNIEETMSALPTIL